MNHHIAVDRELDHFVTGTMGGQIRVWSHLAQACVAEFRSACDLGGERLGLLASASPIVLAGAYRREGVQAYDLSGGVLWRRRDLKRVQSVRGIHPRRHGAVVAVGFEDGPFQFLDAATGFTMERLRGVRSVYAGSDSPLVVAVLRDRFRLQANGATREVRLESFAVLDVALSADGILVSEAAGPLRCFGVDGREQWRWTCPGAHALRVTWNRGRCAWLATVWSYQDGGPLACVEFDGTGNEMARRSLKNSPAHAFTADGNSLITSEAVYGTADLKVMWRLC